MSNKIFGFSQNCDLLIKCCLVGQSIDFLQTFSIFDQFSTKFLKLFFFRTINQSWTRFPAILNRVTDSFSTLAEKQSVVDFRSKVVESVDLGKHQKTFDKTFDKILVKIDKNIQWRNDNMDRIVNWIQSSHRFKLDYWSTLHLRFYKLHFIQLYNFI